MNGRSAFLRTALLLAIAGVTPARADLLVGDFSGSDTTAAHSILRFADAADGNVAPTGSFTTDLAGTRLQTPFHLTYEPAENVVYVADFYGQAIRVYPENAHGNLAPLRTFTSPSLGQPRQIAVSVQHDELYTAVSGCCIGAYPRTGSGNIAALRTVQWGGLSGSITRLNHPSGPVLREISDTLIVADYKQNPDSSYSGVLLSFDRTASGNTAPVSSIEGSATQLGTGAIEPAYDELHDEIIVVSFDSATSTYRILTFAGTASGNTPPLRSIEGPSANLSGVETVAYDPFHETIYIAEGGYNAIPAYVLAFPRLANGNVAPTRTIAGAATGIGYPIGLAVTVDRVFGDGFE
jgi:hypothetical protein